MPDGIEAAGTSVKPSKLAVFTEMPASVETETKPLSLWTPSGCTAGTAKVFGTSFTVCASTTSSDTAPCVRSRSGTSSTRTPASVFSVQLLMTPNALPFDRNVAST